MSKIISYDIVSDEWEDKFILKVNRAIADGWEPTGGPYVLREHKQAMVLRESPDE